MTWMCPGCSSERIEAASLHSAALVPDAASTGKKVFSTGGVVRCRVCLECGVVFDLHVNPAEIVAMLQK